MFNKINNWIYFIIALILTKTIYFSGKKSENIHIV